MNTNDGTYPTADDYAFALGLPPGKRRFKAGKGREILAEFDRGEVIAPERLPYLHRAIGAYAAVYKVRTRSGTWALRCALKRPPDGAGRRYEAVSDFRKKSGTRLLAACGHFDDALYAATGATGRYWPVTYMAWVPGRTLLAEARRRAKAGDRAGLSRLAERWDAAMREKERLGFAHGDLHGDNWHVLPQGDALCAVDYDTMLTPGMPVPSGSAPWCEGYVHPSYSRDGRPRPFDPRMDDFGDAVVLLGLRALAAEPDLLKQWKRDEWLLTREDVEDTEGSEAMAYLCRHKYRDVASVAEALRAECREPAETYALRPSRFATARWFAAVPSSSALKARTPVPAAFATVPNSAPAEAPKAAPFVTVPSSAKGGAP